MQGRDIFLIGAGISAGQAAVFFANHARSVTLVVRGDALAKSMSHYLLRQLGAKSNVHLRLRSEIVAVHGGELLEAVDIVDRRRRSATAVSPSRSCANTWSPRSGRAGARDLDDP